MARVTLMRSLPSAAEMPIVTNTALTGAAFRLEQLLEERGIEVAGATADRKKHRDRLQLIDRQIHHERTTIARAREQASDGTSERQLREIIPESHRNHPGGSRSDVSTQRDC